MAQTEELVVGFGQRERELPPARVYSACITGIYNVGRQWNNFNKEWKPQLKIKFELDALNKNGKPFVVYQDYTASMDARANLRGLVHNLEGRDLTDVEASSYSVGKILGKCCQIQIGHKLKQDGLPKYVIKGIMPSEKEFTPAVPLEKWDFRTSSPDDAPDWVWEAYQRSKDFREPAQPRVARPRTELGQALASEPVATGTPIPGNPAAQDDDVPF